MEGRCHGGRRGAMLPLPSWVADQTKALREAALLASEQAQALGEKVSKFDMGFDEPSGAGQSQSANGGNAPASARTSAPRVPSSARTSAQAAPRSQSSALPVVEATSLSKPPTQSRAAPAAASSRTSDEQRQDGRAPSRPAANGAVSSSNGAVTAPSSTESAAMTALRDELNSTKLRAIRKIKEQEANLEELRLALATTTSEKSALQAQLSQAQLAASCAAQSAPPATPAAPALNGSRTPATVLPGAAHMDDGERVTVLQKKVSAQAKELQIERLARQHAEKAEHAARAEATELRETLAVAEAAASEARSELRLALRTSAVSGPRRHEDVDGTQMSGGSGHTASVHAISSAESGYRPAAALAVEMLLRREIEEAERALASALAEAASSTQSAAAAHESMEEAEARGLLQAAAAKKAEALLRETKTKARDLLEKKDREVAALQVQLHMYRSGAKSAKSDASACTSLGDEGHALAQVIGRQETSESRGLHGAVTDRKQSAPGPRSSDRETMSSALPFLEGVDETIARDLRKHAALQASLDHERAARAEAERRLQRAKDELEYARSLVDGARGSGADEGFLRNTLIKFIEMGEEDNESLLQVLAMHLHFSTEELARLHRARDERAASSRSSLSAGVRALFTPRRPGAPV